MKSPEYSTWLNMRQRCNNPNNPAYRRYGGRGISIHPSWESFEQFYEDMGPKPSPKHSIDRIDNDGNYEPGNCRWADAFEQAANQSKGGTCGRNHIATHCKKGHEFTPENTYVTKRGRRHCRACQRVLNLANYYKNAEKVKQPDAALQEKQ